MENIEAIYELSPVQQGMLFHTLLAPKSGVYFEYLAFTVQGDIDVEAYKRGWQQVVDRHPALRTSFYWDDDELDKPLQIVHDAAELPWTELDWRTETPEQQQEKFQAFLKENQAEGFELDEAPLMRCALIQITDDSYEFVWSFHHLLLDGWSMAIILEDWIDFYQSLQDGKELKKPTPKPYSDYIEWLQTRDVAKSEEFWRKSLAGFSAPTPLPADRVSPTPGAVEGQNGERELFVSAETLRELETIARQNKITLNTIVQGTWALLLSRACGEKDVVFGATTAGRPTDLRDVESMVGMFISSKPMRAAVEPNTKLLPWLKDLQTQHLEQEPHEHSPLVDVQNWSDLPRGLPLFESIVVFQNFPLDQTMRERIPGVNVTNIKTHDQNNFPLSIIATPSDELRLQICYESTRFDDETVDRTLGHFRQLLDGIAANPECELAQLELLTDSERQQILFDWNNTATDFPTDKVFHQQFEDQVARTPDDIAVIFGDEEWTYDQLNRRANRLARLLQNEGVIADQIVALLADRGIDLLTSILAVFKAGGAYLPLDPRQPATRISQVLQESQATIILTQQGFGPVLVDAIQELDSDNGPHVFVVEDWLPGEKEGGNLAVEPASNDLAYVIYTSGSTGIPKGAMIEHRGMLNHLHAKNLDLNLTSNDRLAQTASQCFDISVWQFLSPLLVGGTVFIYPDEIAHDPVRLTKALVDDKITIAETVPSLLLQMLTETEQTENGTPNLPDLRFMMVTGEALPPALCRQWLEVHRDIPLVNAWGPTECSDDITHEFITDPPHDNVVNMSIGKTIANMETYVLNEQMQPLAIGMIGELFVGGVGVGRGYLNRPQWTEERFLPHIFSDDPQARLYKTGDLGRFLPDGSIEFLGRTDHQVKIRGFRIETGEIEAALDEHPGVQQCVVVAWESKSQNGSTSAGKRLLGYVATGASTGEEADDRDEVSTAELRSFLKDRLPEYMVPSVFVVLDALPLSANGKIDRKALPEPDLANDESAEAYVAPRNELEKSLSDIWAQLLGVAQVGIHNDFFDLGGHSLMATQMVSRIRANLEADLPLRDVFEHPTVAQLAEAIENLEDDGESISETITPVSRDQQLPLSFSQQRLWFLDQLEGESSNYNIPVAVRFTGEVELPILQKCVDEIVRRHETLRTSFPSVNGVANQHIADEVDAAVAVLEVEGEAEEQLMEGVVRLATEEARKPFDLATGPLFRISLLKLGTHDCVVLMTMHHIISDGWSMTVILRELAEIYSAFLNGDASPLPELPIQYADFAHWQQNVAAESVLDDQLGYWKEQLADLPPLLELPTDRPRPAVQGYEGGSVQFHVDRDMTSKLEELSQASGATLYMTLFSAFATLLSRHCGQKDFAIGSPIANRNRAEIESLIGFFVNTLVLRADLKDDPTFNDLLQRVRKTCLDAYAHQDVPFEKLVEELQPQRSLSHNSLFQVMLTLQDAPLDEFSLPGVQGKQLDIEHGTIQFDLELLFEQSTDGLKAELEFNSEIFDATTVERMVQQFQTLLAGVVADPDGRASELPLLTDVDREQLLVDWNDTDRDYPTDVCFAQLFADQVDVTPQAVAATYNGEQITYDELNRRANRLANALVEQGIGRDSLVALLAERGIDFLVSILGVFKAGGAYLPLDPHHPASRLAQVIRESGTRLVLTEQPFEDVLHEAIADIDPDKRPVTRRIAETIAGEANEIEPTIKSRPTDLAYVIYTSGSTGTPKGAMVEQRGMMNHLFAKNDDLSLTASDTLAQTASQCFDISVWQFLSPLLVGGSVRIYQNDVAHDPTRLMESVDADGVTVLETVPALLQQMIAQSDDPKAFVQLRYLMVTGEALPPQLARDWLAKYSQIPLVNAWGPTECSDDVTHEFISEPPSNDVVNMPIGRPIANMQVFILDEKMQPVPIGVAGELFVAGIGVGRGYLNRDEWTSDRFLTNPFGPGRIYKTGDLGRFLPDGNIEFLGRIDHQVKIRGFRIELGEIESVLDEHPDVARSVVVAWQGDENAASKRLISYIASEKDGSELMSELSQFVKQRLPEYMVPSTFTVLQELPLTANGKVDRNSLPDPEQSSVQTEFVAPTTLTEKLLAEVWCEILQLEQVGIHHDFFELGGHSLLATQLVTRIRDELSVDLPIRGIFERPNIAELAEWVDAQEFEQAEDDLLAEILAEVDDVSDDELTQLLNDPKEITTQ